MQGSHVNQQDALRRFYIASLEGILHRKLQRSDGLSFADIAASEKRLRKELPTALREYYVLAGNLDINREHNRLYAPKQLKNSSGKLVFMEENQNVVFWAVDIKDSEDPEVFQANNETPLQWYSEN